MVAGIVQSAIGIRGVLVSVGVIFPTRHGPLAPEGTSKTYSVRQVAPERLEWYPLYHTGTRSRSLRVVF